MGLSVLDKKKSRVERVSDAFALFARLLPQRDCWTVISCKEYDQERAAHGYARNLDVYIEKEIGDSWFVVYIDSMTGELVVAQIRNSLGCYHLCYVGPVSGTT